MTTVSPSSLSKFPRLSLWLVSGSWERDFPGYLKDRTKGILVRDLQFDRIHPEEPDAPDLRIAAVCHIEGKAAKVKTHVEFFFDNDWNDHKEDQFDFYAWSEMRDGSMDKYCFATMAHIASLARNDSA